MLRFLIVLHLSIWCFAGDPLYRQSKALYEAKFARDEELYKKFHESPDDYLGIFATEETTFTTENHLAGILQEYQELLKLYGRCPRRRFADCVSFYEHKVPWNDRCPITHYGCNPMERYRPLGGICNNLKNPRVGAVNSPYTRFLDPVYRNYIVPIQSTENNKMLPNPRIMGNEFEEVRYFESLNCSEEDNRVNNLASSFYGQIVTHDMSNRTVASFRGHEALSMRCCKEDNSGPLPPEDVNSYCVPMAIPKNGPFYSNVSVRCCSYYKLLPTLDNKCRVSSPALQNSVSHFLDLSMIYSDFPEMLNKFRSYNGGLFKMSEGNAMPDSICADARCHFGADVRMVQTFMLSAIHVMFFRLHNHVATKLAGLNPTWGDERLFQQARRITIAIYQNILYYEWLPVYLGSEWKLSSKCYNRRYSDRIDPSTSLDFAHAGFRFFHTHSPNDIFLYNENYERVDRFTLGETFNTTVAYSLLENRFGDIWRGLITQGIRVDRQGYASEMRNRVFPNNYRGELVGIDELLFDIVRGRDSGLAPYVDYFPACFGTEIRTWDDLNPFFTKKNLDLLKSFYNRVWDVEVGIGILLENRCKSQAGPTAACIIGEQFCRSKYGDRFFFENPYNPYPFTSAQLASIKRMTFAMLSCLVSGVEETPRDGFVTPSDSNPLVKCNELSSLDLTPFKNIL